MGSSAESTDSENDKKEKGENADMLACIATLTNGKSYPLQNPKMEEGKTTPKKHFTEDSLLSAMERAGADEMPDEVERKGIGTSATRAATIEKLVRIGFVERKGNKKTKYLLPTHKGVALITVMPEQIQSPSMTAEWEQKLLDVEKGAFRDTEFMEKIEGMITELVRTYKIIEDAEVLMHPVLEEIGTCPCCGRHVVERQKGYSCENRQCNFVLWKQNRFFEALGKKMTKPIAVKLLSDGKVALKGCKSKKTGKTYDTKVKPSERRRRTKYPERVNMRDVIREDILKCLDQKPADFEELLKFLQAEGYEIKRGKHTAVCGKEQKRFIRFRSLGEDFTEENLKKVIAGEKELPERNEKVPDRKEAKPEKRKFDLVVDIQEKMAQGKNGGYVRWAKKYNVKQFAESILFLQQHDIHDKETLDALVDGSSAKYHELMKTIKDAEEKMAANKVIKTHIINYAKTRETYIAYRKSGYSKKFFEAHRDEITLHKAAKEAFSKLPDGKIPKVKVLNEEFARLLSEKKSAYSEYKKIKKEMRDYQIAKQNVESFYAAQQSWDIEEDMRKKRQQER